MKTDYIDMLARGKRMGNVDRRCIVFRFDGSNVRDVDLIDYHQENRGMPMKNPPHPGLSVRHDCLEPPGLGVMEAARRLSRKQLSDVVNCLDKAFGGGADTWYRLQSA